MDRNILRLDSEFSFLSSTEGQLYRALLVWAEHWIRAGKYKSLEEAIEEFIPEIEFEHMGYCCPQCTVIIAELPFICLIRVREFLNYVVPSNTLSSEEFKARCIDVMTGSVRRTEEVSSYQSLSRLISISISPRPPPSAPAQVPRRWSQSRCPGYNTS